MQTRYRFAYTSYWRSCWSGYRNNHSIIQSGRMFWLNKKWAWRKRWRKYKNQTGKSRKCSRMKSRTIVMKSRKNNLWKYGKTLEISLPFREPYEPHLISPRRIWVWRRSCADTLLIIIQLRSNITNIDKDAIQIKPFSLNSFSICGSIYLPSRYSFATYSSR